jgi:hypothetical protein
VLDRTTWIVGLGIVCLGTAGKGYITKLSKAELLRVQISILGRSKTGSHSILFCPHFLAKINAM